MKSNILLILCDQLSAAALSVYGNTYSRTPNINSISEHGVTFRQAYTACPLCQPSRASLWTSRYPHQTGIRSNLKDQGFPSLSRNIPALGEYFSQAGYQCIHFGKSHEYGALRGFDVVEPVLRQTERTHPAIPFDYETFMDIDTTQKITSFLKNHGSAPDSPPFLAVADLQNPHNICEYIGEHENGAGDFPQERPLPPLPGNFSFDDIENRPGIIQYMCCAHRRQRQTSGWEEKDFQYYLYAYYYYLEMVDKQIGEILDTLKGSGLSDRTLVVFLADHGEGMAAHQLVTKYAAFYEETNHVPFIFSGPQVKQGASVNGVCSLLDLMPTLLDYAGLTGNGDMAGSSLLPQLTGQSAYTGQQLVSAQWHDEFSGYTIPGRMICDGHFKYTCYLLEQPEELYDLVSDPLETRNLAVMPEYQGLLSQYRQLFSRHLEKTGDDFLTLHVNCDLGCRRHPLGRKYHTGLSAVEKYTASRKQ